MLAGVALGSFGAHFLRSHMHPAAMQIYQIGILYQYIHALGLFVVAWASTQKDSPRVFWAGVCLASGIVFFSGSLYLLVITSIRIFGLFTPIGGLLFIAGWGLLAASSWTRK